MEIFEQGYGPMHGCLCWRRQRSSFSVSKQRYSEPYAFESHLSPVSKAPLWLETPSPTPALIGGMGLTKISKIGRWNNLGPRKMIPMMKEKFRSICKRQKRYPSKPTKVATWFCHVWLIIEKFARGRGWLGVISEQFIVRDSDTFIYF